MVSIKRIVAANDWDRKKFNSNIFRTTRVQTDVIYIPIVSRERTAQKYFLLNRSLEFFGSIIVNIDFCCIARAMFFFLCWTLSD